MRYSFLLLLLSLLTTACGANRELTAEELALVSQLRAELAATDDEISAAAKDDASLSGGLVKALIRTRLEILKTNKALIQQRIHATEARAPITLSVWSYKVDQQEADRLAGEIESQAKEIQAAKEDASRYSGGLVLAMKLSSIATQEQTVAMLKQRQLVAKYGLAYAAASISTENSGAELPREPEVERSKSARLPPADGPFGFKQGLTRADIESMLGESVSLVAGTKNTYLLSTAPKPHGAFERYAAVIGEVPGLCDIRGVGKDISSSRHGIQLKTSFNEVESTLSEIYGPSKKTDRLLAGSIWKDPEDWMMGLLKEERFLFAQWGGSGAPLRNDISSITLVARAKSGDSGYLILEYSFSNHDQCSEEAKSAEKTAL